MTTLRDADRVLAHSYTLEVQTCGYDWCDIVIRHHHVEPVTFGWRDLGELFASMVVLGMMFAALFYALPAIVGAVQ